MNKWQDLRESMREMPLRIGEKLCLDFINSRKPRGDPSLSEQQRATQHEYLSGYTDFLAWSVQASIMTEEDAWPLLEQATLLGSQTEETLNQIILLRENLYMLFWNIASTQIVEAQALAWLHQSYLDALLHARLLKGKEHYAWRWEIEKEHLASPTWPIVQSALELLTTGDHSRIKICPGPPRARMTCGWLFYDESKNKGRHWCSMADCGNQSKAQRQTVRRQTQRKQHQP